jgi:hypothetical protein
MYLSLFKAQPYPVGDTNPCSTSETGGNSNRRHRAGIYGTTGEEMPVKLPTDASFTFFKIRLQEMLVADAIRCDRVCSYRSNGWTRQASLLVAVVHLDRLHTPKYYLYIIAPSSSKHVAAYVFYLSHKICQGVLETLENNFVSVL